MIFLDAGDKVLRAIVDGVRVAAGLGSRDFFRRTHGTDGDRAQGFQPLAHQQPDAARRRMHQHDIALLDRITRSQQKLRGHAFQHEGGGHVEVNPIRQFHQPLGGQHPSCAIGADRHRVRHAIADANIRDTLADLLDDSRGFAAGYQRRRRPGIGSLAVIGVDEVNADGALCDAYFAGPGARFRAPPFEHLGTARGSRHDAKIRRWLRHVTSSRWPRGGGCAPHLRSRLPHPWQNTSARTRGLGAERPPSITETRSARYRPCMNSLPVDPCRARRSM